MRSICCFSTSIPPSFVQALEAGAQVRRILQRHHPERGGGAAVPDGADHAVQFRVSGHAEPGGHRSAGAGKAAEGGKQLDPIRKLLPEEYGTLPIEDHEAFR